MESRPPTTPDPEAAAAEPTADAPAEAVHDAGAGDPETIAGQEAAAAEEEAEPAPAVIYVPLPTPGRVVLFQDQTMEQPLPAMVTRHWSNGAVDLEVFSKGNGVVRYATSVSCAGETLEQLQSLVSGKRYMGWIYPPRVDEQIEVPLPS